MKRVLMIVTVLALTLPTAHAGDKNKKTATKVERNDSTEIHWLNWDEVQEKMKIEPRKVWVDIYTDWCGWCKVMDKKTYANKDVIKYMNTKFYAVKFNAEKQDSIRFMGRMYYISPEHRVNELAFQLMHEDLTYPTNIYMQENFQNPFPIKGYIPVDEMEVMLKFLGENMFQKMNFEEYKKTFVPEWKAEEGG